MQCLGYLSVGMFFFYTGYGLMLSCKKSGYLNTFFCKRVIPLYTFYVVLIITYTIYDSLLGIYIEPNKLVQSFLFGYSLVPLAWYLQVTFLIYLIYWVVFKMINSDVIKMSVIGIILVLLCIICFRQGLSTTWYEGFFCILFGMVWSWKKEKIDKALTHSSLLLLGIVVVLFVAFTLMQLRLGVISKMLSAATFSAMVTIFAYLVADTKIVNNKIAQFLGRNSLGIYVSQGFFLILRKQTKILDNTYIFIAVTIIGTMVIAIVMQLIYVKITGLFRNSLNVE